MHGASYVEDFSDSLHDAKRAKQIYPYENRFRTIYARLFVLRTNLTGNNIDQVKLALVELEKALVLDPTAADLIAYVVSFKLILHDDAGAQAAYDQLKRVAPASQLVKNLGGSFPASPQ